MSAEQMNNDMYNSIKSVIEDGQIDTKEQETLNLIEKNNSNKLVLKNNVQEGLSNLAIDDLSNLLSLVDNVNITIEDEKQKHKIQKSLASLKDFLEINILTHKDFLTTHQDNFIYYLSANDRDLSEDIIAIMRKKLNKSISEKWIDEVKNGAMNKDKKKIKPSNESKEKLLSGEYDRRITKTSWYKDIYTPSLEEIKTNKAKAMMKDIFKQKCENIGQNFDDQNTQNFMQKLLKKVKSKHYNSLKKGEIPGCLKQGIKIGNDNITLNKFFEQVHEKNLKLSIHNEFINLILERNFSESKDQNLIDTINTEWNKNFPNLSLDILEDILNETNYKTLKKIAELMTPEHSEQFKDLLTKMDAFLGKDNHNIKSFFLIEGDNIEGNNNVKFSDQVLGDIPSDSEQVSELKKMLESNTVVTITISNHQVLDSIAKALGWSPSNADITASEFLENKMGINIQYDSQKKTNSFSVERPIDAITETGEITLPNLPYNGLSNPEAFKEAVNSDPKLREILNNEEYQIDGGSIMGSASRLPTSIPNDEKLDAILTERGSENLSNSKDNEDKKNEKLASYRAASLLYFFQTYREGAVKQDAKFTLSHKVDGEKYEDAQRDKSKKEYYSQFQNAKINLKFRKLTGEKERKDFEISQKSKTSVLGFIKKGTADSSKIRKKTDWGLRMSLRIPNPRYLIYKIKTAGPALACPFHGKKYLVNKRIQVDNKGGVTTRNNTV